VPPAGAEPLVRRLDGEAPLKLCCQMHEMAQSYYVMSCFMVINDSDCQCVYIRKAAAEF